MPLFILDSNPTPPFIYPDEELPAFPARNHYILGGCVFCWKKALDINPFSVAAGILADRIWHYGLDTNNYDIVNNNIIDIIDKHPTPKCMRFWYCHTKRTNMVWSIV
jgi:hypothetical protein